MQRGHSYIFYLLIYELVAIEHWNNEDWNNELEHWNNEDSAKLTLMLFENSLTSLQSLKRKPFEIEIIN